MDFLILPIGWRNWLLLVACIINLSMAVFIFRRGIKNKVNLYFSLFLFSSFLWSFSTFLGIVLQSIFWSKFWFQTSFVWPLSIAVFLFYFVSNFPFKNINLKSWQNFFIWACVFVLSIFAYTRWNFVNFIKIKQTNQFIIEYGVIFQWTYSLYLVILVVGALYILWVKHKQAENFLKKNILILFWTILIGFILGLYFNLYLDYIGNFNFNWFGPVFSLLVNFGVFYLIFSKRSKQIEY